jgi:hypothetical protein
MPSDVLTVVPLSVMEEFVVLPAVLFHLRSVFAAGEAVVTTKVALASGLVGTV